MENGNKVAKVQTGYVPADEVEIYPRSETPTIENAIDIDNQPPDEPTIEEEIAGLTPPGDFEEAGDEIVDEDLATEQPKSRWQRIADTIGPTPVAVWMGNRFESAKDYFMDERDGRRRRWVGAALGAAALFGTGILLGKYGIPFSGGGNGQKEAITEEIIPPVPKTIQPAQLDLTSIRPDTITAHTPDEFQRGVLDLLDRQGIHASGVNAEKIQHMNDYMDSIASGMKRSSSGELVQNVVEFPSSGKEFANANASAAQGFTNGPRGSGREALHDWIREAERVGIKFTKS